MTPAALLAGPPAFGAPPPWLATAGLVTVAALAAATAASAWVAQRGRRAVLARLVRHRGDRAHGGLADPLAADALTEVAADGWRGALLAALARLLPPAMRSEAAAAPLARAGYFEPSAVLYFGGLRVAALVVCPLLVFAVTGAGTPLALALGVVVGAVAPTALLDRKAGERRTALVLGIPDALDLLVVCMEAGVGVDAALVRVARELTTTHPVLAAELENVTRRVSAGLPRDEAFRALVARTGVADLRAIVTTMLQAERLGTSLARVLRVHGEALRSRRKQVAEKRAAEASVKMVVPLVLFLLPAFFTVVLGPAILSYVFGEGGL